MMTERPGSRCYTLVRGSAEVASGVAHALFKAGFPVVMHEVATPTAIRRRMAFTDAVFDGTAILSGVTAQRADSRAALSSMLVRRRFLPISIAPLPELLRALPWAVVVDARMRPRPEPQMRLAPLSIGVGPGFVAGQSVVVAIETAWERLGRVVTRGATMAAGEAETLAGIGVERYICAPFSGTFRSRYDIGHWVTAGDVIGQLDDMPLAAPLTGVLRGIARDEVPVPAGAEVIEVDPRGWDAVYSGIGERPFKVAEAVLAVFEAVDWAALLESGDQSACV